MRHLEEVKVDVDSKIVKNPQIAKKHPYNNLVLGKLELKLIGLDEKLFHDTTEQNHDKKPWETFYSDIQEYQEVKNRR